METLSASPSAEVIHSLVGLHQEQHKVLLDMRDDQEKRFHALVQAQQEDRDFPVSWASTVEKRIVITGTQLSPLSNNLIMQKKNWSLL